MNQRREELPPIKYRELAEALLPMADTLVPQWLPGGQRIGHEWRCGSLAGEAGDSCSVNLVTGQWADFAGADDEKGNDLLGLYGAIHNLTAAKAAVQLARQLGLEGVAGLVKTAAGAAIAPVANPRPAPAPKPAAEKEEWSTVQPVPDHAPPPSFRHHHRQPKDLIHTATYALDGEVFGYVVRFRTSDDGKDTLPYTFCQSARDGSQKWHWKTWDEPRPLYLPGGKLPNGRTVLLVEGEVKAELLQYALDAAMPGLYCVVSWPGGCKVWQKADWTWLAGSTVLGWPDCDAHREALSKAERDSVKDDEVAREALQATKPLLPEVKQPGMKAMLGIGALLRDTHACTVQLLPIPKPGEKKSGWDCADAIAEGWTVDDLLAFFGRAQPLPTSQTAKPVAETADPEKNLRSPVGTEGRGSSGFVPGGAKDDGDEVELVKCGGRLVPLWLSWYWDGEKKRWNITRKAVISALENDPALKGIVAFNELSNSLQCRRAWPWPNARAGDIGGADELLLGKYLTDTYGLPSVSSAALEEAIKTVGYTERYHPIREWLVGLKWDGKPRLDRWLPYVLRETPETMDAGLAEYLGLVSRFWVLGMVWRVMKPGCKFDYCPVLEGKGGLRKSTLIEELASGDWYSDTKFDVGKGKEAQEQVQGIWLYEIAELAGFTKADVNDIKSFISSKHDRYRVAYGKTVEKFARQCVMAGSTNQNTYLRDRTGNRRFWPVPVQHVINTEWVQRNREQLFAEAFALYLQGVAYTPTEEREKRLFAPMQGSRLIETAVEGQLLRYLTREQGAAGDVYQVNRETKFVTVAQLVQALGVDVAKSTAGLENQIRDWLGQYGWEYCKKMICGVRAWGFLRPAVWPPVEVDDGEGESGGDTPLPPPAPTGEAPAEPSGYVAPPLSSAAQFLADMNDDQPF